MFLRTNTFRSSTLRVADSIIYSYGRPFLAVASHNRYYSSPADKKPKDVPTAVVSGVGASASASTDAHPTGNIGLTYHRVNNFEKFVLVWNKTYKNMNEVPDYVSQDRVERARNKARIKFNIMMGLATLFGCFLMIRMGKKARDKGESVTKMNEEWHKSMNEKSRLKEEGKPAQESK